MAQARRKGILHQGGEPAAILVVDDHPIVRHGLVELINACPALKVCGETDNAREAVSMFNELEPDLVLIDIRLKDVSGIELIKQIRSQDTKVKLLVASMCDDKVFAERALHAGANGYISKDVAVERLVDAICEVLDGQIHISKEVTNRLVRRATGSSDASIASPVEMLSDRELEVFELLGRGQTTQQVAKGLSLSPKTVDTYKQHIKSKLKLASTNELMVRAAHWVMSLEGEDREDQNEPAMSC